MHLPRSSARGFTLIELMVAIAIVAILATVGLVVFANTQKQARDSRRTQDIAAIANALQGKRPAGSVYYVGLTGAQDFSNGNVPTDPKTGAGAQERFYCIYYLATIPPVPPPAKPAYWGTTACPGVAGATTVRIPGDYSSSALQLPPNTVTSWLVCASLEGSSSVVCEGSKI